MGNYLIEREALEQFVDELFKQKPLPANSAEELYSLREKTIQDLDDHLGLAIFNQLSDEQLNILNKTIDRGEDTPEFFDNFFENSGIDLKGTIASASEAFRNNFLRRDDV